LPHIEIVYIKKGHPEALYENKYTRRKRLVLFEEINDAFIEVDYSFGEIH